MSLRSATNLALTLAVLLSACGGPRRRAPSPYDGLKAVGFRVMRTGPEAILPRPATGPWSGFKKGMKAGFNAVGGSAWFSGPVSASDKGGGGLIYAGILALVTAASVTGGTYGSLAGLLRVGSAESVEAERLALEGAVRRADAASALRAALAERVGDGPRLVDIESAPGEPVDARLLVEVLHVGLVGGDGMDPPLEPLVSVRLRLEVPGFPPVVRFAGSSGGGGRARFRAWAAEDGKALEAALRRAVPELAEAAARTLRPR
ncbi:MAG: hypothetical protein HY928_03190 [Elusimicrobia bacterium]|nr:hypothetical protein [Elusimicrobiota bacterium]